MILTENTSTVFFFNIENHPSAVDSLKWLERQKISPPAHFGN